MYVCLSKSPKQRKIKVKILLENYIPKKGEHIQVIGRFRFKENAQRLAKYSDIQKAWGTALFVTDETMWDYLPHR